MRRAGLWLAAADPLTSPACEEHSRARRGQQGEGRRRRRGVGAGARARRGLAGDRQGGAHPGLPSGQGPPSPPRDPDRARLRPERGPAQRPARAVHQGGHRARHRRRRPAGAGHHRRRGVRRRHLRGRGRDPAGGHRGGLRGLRVEVPSPEVGEAEMQEQVDRLRTQYGELADVERPAGEGDYVTIDIEGTRDGERSRASRPRATATSLGSGAITAEFDEHLTGHLRRRRRGVRRRPPGPRGGPGRTSRSPSTRCRRGCCRS